MKYKNKKTGGVIETPFVVSGGDWVPFNQNTEKKLEIKQVQENEETNHQEGVTEQTPIVEEKTDNPAIDEVSKDDIMQELDAFGVKYNPRDKKQVLYDLMMAQGKE